VKVTCAAGATALAYTCSYTASGSENGSYGGATPVPQPFDVRVRDVAQNETVRNLVGSLNLDFNPPSPATFSVTYLAAPGNPLPTVTRATAGTTIRMTVEADEPLNPNVVPTLVAHGPAGTTLPFQLLVRDATSATFEAIVRSADPDGDYPPTLTWSDVAGNVRTAVLPGAPARIKNSRPLLQVNQPQVTYVRSPWGIAGEGPGAGPLFELAPADPLSAAQTLPTTTFTTEADAPAAVRAWSDSRKSWLLALVFPAPDGQWPRTHLQPIDTPSVWTTALDDAGNESDPVQIANVEWVATSTPPPAGASPHAVDTSSYLRESFVPDPDTALPLPSPTSLGQVNPGNAEYTARAQVAVRKVGSPPAPAWTTAAPEASMAFDADRGRVVAHVGSGNAWNTFEWDGWTWTDLTPTWQACQGSSCAVGATGSVAFGGPMTFDAARGRVVMTAGYGTWEWDGATWTLAGIECVTPGDCRLQHRIAYDAARRVAVSFGGPPEAGGSPDARTWEWDGSDWTVRATAAAPPPLEGHGLAHDARRGRVVLFGGCLVPCTNPTAAGALSSDVWEYDGTSWAKVSQAGAPPGARYSPYLVYDSRRETIVLAGGYAEGGVPRTDVREWNGTTWTDQTPAAPTFTMPPLALATPSLSAFDASRSRQVLVAGSETWERTGIAWTRTAPGSSPPPARKYARLAFDESRGRVVMYGGCPLPCPNFYAAGALSSDVWEWDGLRWVNATPASPPSPVPRLLPAMTYDPDAGKVVIFGGDTPTVTLNDVWEWNGTTWAQRPTTGAAPPVRMASQIAFDRARHALVLFGGRTYTGTWVDLNDTWELTGPVSGSWAWTQRAPPPAPAPPPNLGLSLLYDGTRTLAFLGSGSGNVYLGTGSVWQWTGTEWSDVSPPFAETPKCGSFDAMAWDGIRGRAYGFGFDLYAWTGSAYQALQAPGATWPTYVDFGAMTFDLNRSRGVFVDGTTSITWELDSDIAQNPNIPGASPIQARSPMAQFTASYADAGFAAADVTGLRVRAYAGGRYGAGATGARLMGWRTGGSAVAAGRWVALATNAAAAPELLSWEASAADVPFFFVERDARLAFQLRPAGYSAPAQAESEVGVDYIEVRVRYRAP
jgi:hypothetical protein